MEILSVIITHCKLIEVQSDQIVSVNITNSFILISSFKNRTQGLPPSRDHRLCVIASGSVIFVVMNWLTLTNISRLHLGQNSRKFLSSVSCRSFTRVLLPQAGHRSHFSVSSIIITFPSASAPVCGSTTSFYSRRQGSYPFRCCHFFSIFSNP